MHSSEMQAVLHDFDEGQLFYNRVDDIQNGPELFEDPKDFAQEAFHSAKDPCHIFDCCNQQKGRVHGLCQDVN